MHGVAVYREQLFAAAVAVAAAAAAAAFMSLLFAFFKYTLN